MIGAREGDEERFIGGTSKLVVQEACAERKECPNSVHPLWQTAHCPAKMAYDGG